MSFARTPLETAIFHSGRMQKDIAEETGIDATWLSRIVRGRAVPTRDEKERIAKALGAGDSPRSLQRRINELFPVREEMTA